MLVDVVWPHTIEGRALKIPPENKVMARRPAVVTPKRVVESEANGFSTPTSPPFKSQSSSIVSFCVVFIVGVLIFCYVFGDSVLSQASHRDTALDNGVDQSLSSTFRSLRKASSSAHDSHHLTKQEERDEESVEGFSDQKDHQSSHSSCRVGVCGALPILEDVYGNFMHKMLHVGPGTCGVVSELLKEENIEVWGIQPFEMVAPVSKLCHNFIKKGIVRVAEVYRPLPYRSSSFSLVLVSDTLENLSSKRLNRTLPELSRLSAHRLVVFIGNQNSQATSAETMDATSKRRQLINSSSMKPAKIRNRTWWLHHFELVGLREDEETTKRFENLQQERSYRTTDFIFHLIAPHSISLSR